MRLSAPTSVADVLDRLTILELKLAHAPAGPALANVTAEREALLDCWHDAGLPDDVPERSRLSTVNQQLWNVEDDLRRHEADGCFDDTFTELARSVYRLNDERAAIKRAINLRFKSTIHEEKFLPNYGRG